MSGDNIGMMEGAFFVGRGELLSWVNETFQLNLTKVEQVATGAVYCQIIDAIYPNTVQMGKVKWQAKHDYEYVENYKVLQQAFAKNEIKRYIDVDKLTKAKYQDNLELLQWLKRYFDINYNGEPYDPVGRRKGQDLYYILGGNKVGSAQGAGVKASAGARTLPSSKPSGSSAQPKPSAMGSALGAGLKSKVSAAGGAGAIAAADTKALQAEVSDLKMNMDTLEKERDFYFAKLRDIEMLMQVNPSQANPLTENILKILYASEEEKVHIEEDGTLTITGGGAQNQGGDEDMLNEEENKDDDESLV